MYLVSSWLPPSLGVSQSQPDRGALKDRRAISNDPKSNCLNCQNNFCISPQHHNKSVFKNGRIISPSNQLTLSPEAETPLSRGNLAIAVRVAWVEKRSDTDLILLQVYSSQLRMVQVEVITGVQLGEHPANRVLAACHQVLLKHCRRSRRRSFPVCVYNKLTNPRVCIITER